MDHCLRTQLANDIDCLGGPTLAASFRQTVLNGQHSDEAVRLSRIPLTATSVSRFVSELSPPRNERFNKQEGSRFGYIVEFLTLASAVH